MISIDKKSRIEKIKNLYKFLKSPKTWEGAEHVINSMCSLGFAFDLGMSSSTGDGAPTERPCLATFTRYEDGEYQYYGDADADTIPEAIYNAAKLIIEAMIKVENDAD